MSKQVIGIFDSGIGGLTVLQALHATYPYLSFIYYGDCANAPWGHRSKEELSLITHNIIQFLMNKNVHAIVSACNTSYSFFGQDIYKNYQIPFFGLTNTACDYAIRISDTHRVAILGTEGTISSRSYGRYLEQRHPNIQLLELACPDLVPLIEQHDFHSELVSQAVLNYVDQIASFDADTLIYACSHYPFLDHYFQMHCQDKLHRVNPADTLRHALPHTLISNVSSDELGFIDFYISGEIDRFSELVSRLPFSNYRIHSHSF